jgi:hypothetical protein
VSYLSTAEKLYGATHKKLDSYGLVRDCYGFPYFDKPTVSLKSQSFYLLMEAREKC